MILRVFVDSRVDFNPITQVLVLYEVGEFVWSSIWVVVLAGLSFEVVVLLRGGRPGGGGSSSGWRVLGRALQFFEWDSLKESACLPSGPSASFPSAVDLAIVVKLSLVRLLAERSWWGDEDACGELELLERVRSGSSPRVMIC